MSPFFISRFFTRLTTSAALIASLAACKAVGPDFHAPAPVSTAGSYGMPGEALPNSQHIALGQKVADDWWAAFRSPDLDRVMRQALADNPSLAAANATLAQAQANLAAARGARLPEVNLTAGAQRERINLASFGFNAGALPGFSNNPEFSLYSIGGGVSYPLDLWGGTRRAIESAAAQAKAQEYQTEAAYLTLTGNVATQAATIAAIRAEIGTVQAVIADDRKNIELLRMAQAAGGEAQAPGIGAEAQLAADQALLPPLAQQLAVARHALALLAGKAPADFTASNFDLAHLALPAEIPVSLGSELVHQRPDILQAEANLHAATAEIGVATARLYPTITLTANLTQSALTPEKVFDFPSTAYNLGAGLTAPIFDGGRLRAQRFAALQAANAARATYQATVLRAFGQIADLLQALAHDEQAVAAEQRSVEAAAASLRLARTAFQEGGAGLLPVVDAERTDNNARLALTRAQAQRYLDTVQLFVATGHGWRMGTAARR